MEVVVAGMRLLMAVMVVLVEGMGVVVAGMGLVVEGMDWRLALLWQTRPCSSLRSQLERYPSEL